MGLFCDVALPVPLDQTFTYAVNGVVPVVGARVLVPFSGQKLMGVVVRVHEDAPAEEFEIKPVQQVLDDTAILPAELMKLAEWIAQYYVAPLGEVLRGMLPLAAEVKRQYCYRIAEAGRGVLYWGGGEAVAEERDARRLERVAVVVGSGISEQRPEDKDEKQILRCAKDDNSKIET